MSNVDALPHVQHPSDWQVVAALAACWLRLTPEEIGSVMSAKTSAAALVERAQADAPDLKPWLSHLT